MTRRLQALLAFLDLRRGQPRPRSIASARQRRRRPSNIEVLLTRAEIVTFAGARDAPELVRVAAAARRRRPVPQRAVPGEARARVSPAARRVDVRGGGDLRRDRSPPTESPSLAGADWPMVFMQNAAVHALRGQIERRRSTSSTADTRPDGGTGARSQSIRCWRRSGRSRDSRSCCRASRPTSPRCARAPIIPGCPTRALAAPAPATRP